MTERHEVTRPIEEIERALYEIDYESLTRGMPAEFTWILGRASEHLEAAMSILKQAENMLDDYDSTAGKRILDQEDWEEEASPELQAYVTRREKIADEQN